MNNTIKYYLPERVLKLTVNYVVKQELTFNEKEEVATMKYRDCYIQDDILLEPLLHADYQCKYIFDYSRYRSWCYNLSFEAEFDENGAGILQAINIETTPVVKDVIVGVVNVAVSLAKLGTTAFLVDSPTHEEPLNVEVIEKTFTETYLIKTGDMNEKDGSRSIQLPKPNVGDLNTKIPTIEVFIKPNKIIRQKKKSKNICVSKTEVYYREPILSNVKIKVLNNGDIQEQTVINEYIYFSQFGATIPLQISFGKFFNKASSKVSFSKATGGLEKFALTNESKIKETVDDFSTSLNAMNTTVGEWHKSKKEKVAEIEKKNKVKSDDRKEKLKNLADKELNDLIKKKGFLEVEKKILILKKEIVELKK
ncbi:hypothetical protein CLV84_0704 [Neolewinella xylanilytica]|uniref:Uncharacterized protein n=1 Tax=Neolewinella xylanilytica TaxID=1514080 RepID=A0A2S6I8D8_9BACT|nr:hypothetical protein [Neolewinella xylanilytica]PPK87753.1 hypothetical protein CLV84_0704 [Neolewinella xylanilytica]